MNLNDIIIFSPDSKDIQVSVRVDQETVWLNLNQLSHLFERDKSVISRHLKNIFKEEELDKQSTVAFFATVQIEGGHDVLREIEHYNLDAIISVGYRVNSKRGIEFRQWASKILKSHLLKGYSLNHSFLREKGILELNRSIQLLFKTFETGDITNNNIGPHIVNIIAQYAKTWHLLLGYDEEKLSVPSHMTPSDHVLSLENCLLAISNLKNKLIREGEASELFGKQKDTHLAAILGSLHQTFGAKFLYPSQEERAAHLLYFVIKDHPFVDGNKRIGCLLFLLYLKTHHLSADLILIEDVTLVALALLIAESEPSDKDLMIKLILNMLMRPNHSDPL